MTTRLLLFAAILFASGPSWAAWHACDNAANAVSRVAPGSGGPSEACFDFTATGLTGFVNTTACAVAAVELAPDISGSTGTAEAQVYNCNEAATDDCRKVIGDTDGDGIVNDVTLTGDETAMRRGVADNATSYVYVEITAASTTAGRLKLICKP